MKNRDGCTLRFAHPGGGKVKLKLTKKEIKRLIRELEQSILRIELCSSIHRDRTLASFSW